MIFTGLRLALRLQLLDRFPLASSSEVLWTTLGVKHAFSVRWDGSAVSASTIRWYERLDRLAARLGRTKVVALRNQAIARSTSAGVVALANAGPGQRHKNSFQVALAVDAHLGGAPSTALPWAEDADPVLAIPIDHVVGSADDARLASNGLEARRIVASWGDGAKGIVSLRDPDLPAHCVFNAVNVGGEAIFLDYSDSATTHLWASHRRNVDAEVRADQRLHRIDERSGFASVRLWRTADRPGVGALPDAFYDLGRDVAAEIVDAALPVDMSIDRRRTAFNRIWAVGDLRYARWLVTQIQRGACTLDPHHYDLLANGRTSELSALTDHDDALLQLVGMGSIHMAADIAEIAVADTLHSRRLIDRFVPVVIRAGLIDGLEHDVIEACISDAARQRLAETAPSFRPLSLDISVALPVSTNRSVRRPSWVDVNRGAGDGTRRTNCWNTASAVANYLSTAAPSMSLPIYRAAPLRPTIPDYLKMVGATGSPLFVADLAEADTVVSAWGPSRHGLVVASLNDWSTHIFNVVHDGERIRYLDAHTAEEGDFNFDVRWQRIGVVEVGALDERLVAGRWRPHGRPDQLSPAQLTAAQLTAAQLKA